MATEKMKESRVSGSGGLEELLDGVVREVLNAAAHWDLLKRLDAAISDHREEMEQSEEFWGLTLKAHYDVVLFYLGRLYDQEGCAISLGRLLLTVKSLARVPEESNKLRLPFGSAPGLEESVDKDLENVSVSDPLVKRLSELRNRVLSHTAPRLMRLPDLSSLALSSEDIGILIERAIQIGNKYSILYRVSPFSRQAVGGDDYKNLLSLLTRGLASVHAEREAETHRIGEQAPSWSPADCFSNLI
jgi:hypothetical protein